MTRWIAYFSLFVTLFARTACAGWPEGVLNYCGFEGYWDEAGWRDLGWMAGGTEGISFDRDQKRHGKASLRIVGAAKEQRGVNQLNGNTVQPGKRYVIRVWVKTKEIVGEAAIALQPHEEGIPLPYLDLGQNSRLQGTRDWTLIEVPVPELPAKTVRVFPYFWVRGTGTAWFDEFSLAKSGVTVPLGGEKPVTESDYAGVRYTDSALPGNLVKNPGFEEGLHDWYVESSKPQIEEASHASGQRCLRLDGFPQCGYTVVQVGVKIDPRRAYRLSLRQKTDLRAGLFCVQLLPIRANGVPIGYHSQDHTSEYCYGRGTKDWRETAVVLRNFPVETESVNIYLLLEDAVGTVWIDDVRFAPLSMTETEKARKP